MPNSKKIGTRILLIAPFFILIYFSVQWKTKIEIQESLSDKIPEYIKLDYKDLNVNILFGDLILKDVSLAIHNRGEAIANCHTFLKISKLKINGFSYWKMIFNNTIDIEDIILEKPELRYYPYSYVPDKENYNKGNLNLSKSISVGTFEIQYGSFQLIEKGGDSLKVSVDSFDLKLFGAKTNPHLITEKIPIKYDDFQLHALDIFTDLGRFETLTIAQIDATKEALDFQNIHLASKYGKKELSKHISVERDYVDLSIPEIIVEKLDVDFKEDRFGIEASSLSVLKPNAEIYRDKLLEDDLSTKPLFGSLLRNLPIDVVLGSIKIENGHLSYEEKIDEAVSAGMLFFDNINADITHVSNLPDAEITKIQAKGDLMGKAEIRLNWDFDVNASDNAFNASGSLQNLNTSLLNPFFEPNLRVRSEGTIDQLYFTISGNRIESKGDVKMKYEDFKFSILNKDRLKIKKLLSAIGNIFVNDGSKTDVQGYRHGRMEVERQSNKSFYNYLWVNLREGIINTLTGKGERKER